MALVPTIKKGAIPISKFVDFDKEKRVFYNNIYLDEFKMCVKIPFAMQNRNGKKKKKIKLSKFNLVKYTYLLSYD